MTNATKRCRTIVLFLFGLLWLFPHDSVCTPTHEIGLSKSFAYLFWQRLGEYLSRFTIETLDRKQDVCSVLAEHGMNEMLTKLIDPTENALEGVASTMEKIKQSLHGKSSLNKQKTDGSKDCNHELFLLRAMFELFAAHLDAMQKYVETNRLEFTAKNSRLGMDAEDVGPWNPRKLCEKQKRKNAISIETIRRKIASAKVRALEADFRQFEAHEIVGKFQVQIGKPQTTAAANSNGLKGMQIGQIENELPYAVVVTGEEWGKEYTYVVQPGETKALGLPFPRRIRVPAAGDLSFLLKDDGGWQVRIFNCKGLERSNCIEVLWYDSKYWTFGNYGFKLRLVKVDPDFPDLGAEVWLDLYNIFGGTLELSMTGFGE